MLHLHPDWIHLMADTIHWSMGSLYCMQRCCTILGDITNCCGRSHWSHICMLMHGWVVNTRNKHVENWMIANFIFKCDIKKLKLDFAICILTLNVWGPSYLGLTTSISWLLMPWLLTSPGHQQPWYWLYRICRFFSYLRKCFKYLCQISVEEWHKMQIYVYVPSEKFSM